MSNTPLYIFDLDGTLALIEHRRHLVTDGNKKWNEFYKQCVNDTANAPVVKTMNLLLQADCDILIFSGRSEVVRQETIDWLINSGTNNCLCMDYQDVHEILFMRPENDFTPDDALKKQWYQNLPKVDRDRLIAVFDDRQKVVDMWRSIGVPCFQVAPGDF